MKVKFRPIYLGTTDFVANPPVANLFGHLTFTHV